MLPRRRHPAKRGAGLGICGVPAIVNTAVGVPETSVWAGQEGIVSAVSKGCHFLRGSKIRSSAQAMDFLNSRRKIFPEAVLGTESTKWT
jgi:hypothetical protein